MTVLHISAAILIVYAVISLVLPLQIKKTNKLLLSLVLALCGSKFVIYTMTGGVFTPKLGVNTVLALEVLYSFLLLSVVCAIIKDVVLLGRTIARKIEKGSSGKRGVGKSSRAFSSASGHLDYKPWPIGRINTVIVAVSFIAALGGTLSQLRTPKVVEHTVYVQGLPKSFDGYTMVQLTDLHIGPILKGDFLAGVVERTNSLKPDLVLITGDFVDGSVAALKNEFLPFKELRAKNGVLAVTGNHEYYSGANSWVKTWEEMGVKFLRNQSVLITQGNFSLQVAGIPDPRGQSMGEIKPDPAAALKNIVPYAYGSYTSISAPTPADAKAKADPKAQKNGKKNAKTAAFNEERLGPSSFSIKSRPLSGIASEQNKPVAVIFMAHQPVAVTDPNLKANLVLTGHTHGGTMFFLQPLIAYFNAGYVSGMYDLDNGGQLYVSNGTGIWSGFSCRIFVPAEITKFTLRRI